MAQQAEGKRVRCWIRLGGYDVELQPGTTTIGRHDSCDVVLDDPLASRRHAELRLADGELTIRDLGSVNGLAVNGSRVLGSLKLNDGDEIRAGNQIITVHMGADLSRFPARSRVGAQTLTSVSLAPALSVDEEPTEVRNAEALETLALVAEKVLAMGRGAEAERILRKPLLGVRTRVHSQESVEPDTLKIACEYAVRIAEATNNWEWIDYVFELYTKESRVLPGPVIDRLYNSARAVSEVKLDTFRRYLSMMQSKQSALGPADRFLLRRVEGLERLLGL